jgi:hypothetical protein
MEFDLRSAREMLERTPATVGTLLARLPEGWTHRREGPERWSAFEVVGHLIHGERTDWIPRARLILEHGASKTFEPFDRFAMLKEKEGSLEVLLERFAALRRESLEALDGFGLTPEDLKRQGRHPELGIVTLEQLLSTWVVHDLGHVVQIARVLAKAYADEVGPWTAYLGVLRA